MLGGNRVITADTATSLPARAAGAMVVCGSHGGLYPGYLLAKAGVRAAILCDAGIGREEAGIASLPYFAALGIPAAAASHLSCRIGDVDDMLARGTISRANEIAARLDVRPGDPVAEAARKLAAAPATVTAAPPSIGEGRNAVDQAGRRPILLLDSAAMVGPGDEGAIIVTGSHGGLVGDPAKALKATGFAGVFNDAGIGVENAGLARLPALDARRIAAFTVAADSCRIGDARSSFEDGVISAVNEAAHALGARVGAQARGVLLDWAAR